MTKKAIALALCIVFLVSTSVIPSSAHDGCPDGEHTGELEYFDRIEYYDPPYPTDDYCCFFIQVDQWNCCGALVYTYGNMSHRFEMTGASYMTCTYCGFGRPVK